MAQEGRRIIEELLRGFRRKNKTDQAIERAARVVLSGSTDISLEDGQIITLEVLNPRSNRWRQSAVAIWALGHLEVGPRTFDQVARQLILFADRRQDDDNAGCALDAHLRISVISGLSVGIITIVTGLIIGSVERSLDFTTTAMALAGSMFLVVIVTLLVLALGIVIVPPVAAIGYRSLAEGPRWQAINTLARWKVTAAMGPVSREISRSRFKQNPHLYGCLKAMLDLITAEDYGTFSARDQQSLAALLFSTSCHSPMQRRIIRTLGHIGGAPALSSILKYCQVTTNPDLRSYASSIIPAVELRAKREADSANLMRPASALIATSNTLLLPALAGAWTSDKELLRTAADPGDTASPMETVELR